MLHRRTVRLGQTCLAFFVNLSKECIETSGFQVLFDPLVPDLYVVIFEPAHQLSQVLGRQLSDGPFNLLDAHILGLHVSNSLSLSSEILCG
jgi:hypothetical protein